MFKNKRSDKSDSRKSGGKNFSKDKRSDFKDDRKKTSGPTKTSSTFKKKDDTKFSDKPKTRTIKKDVDFVESKSFKRKTNDDIGKDLFAKRTSDKPDYDKKRFSSDKPKADFTKKSGERKSYSSDKPFSGYDKKSSDRKPFSDTKSKEKRSYSSDKPFAEYERKSSSKNFEKPNSEKPLKGKQTRNFRDDSDFELDDLNEIGNEKPRVKKAPIPKSLKNILKTSSSENGDVRLNKIIANAGICSRREADDFITAGVVKVNGKVISELGYKVKASDLVTYNGETIRREKMVYYLMNKPKDFITTTDDPQDRKTVMSLISGIKERIYPVGRLDRNTTGILVFTNDGDLTKKLTHPSFEIKKIYHAFLDKPFKKEDMEKLKEGLHLHDGFIKPDDVSYVTGAKSKHEVGIELHSGKNRIVRRIFEHLGYVVDRLDRVYFAGLTKKDLSRGDWRELTEREVATLKSL